MCWDGRNWPILPLKMAPSAPRLFARTCPVATTHNVPLSPCNGRCNNTRTPVHLALALAPFIFPAPLLLPLPGSTSSFSVTFYLVTRSLPKTLPRLLRRQKWRPFVELSLVTLAIRSSAIKPPTSLVLLSLVRLHLFLPTLPYSLRFRFALFSLRSKVVSLAP